MNEQYYKQAFYALITIVNFALGWENNNRGSIFSGMASGMFFAMFLLTFDDTK